MIRRKLILFVCLTFMASTSYGLVIGNWEDSSGDGWIDWGSGASIADPCDAHEASYSLGGTTYGVTLDSQSLQVTTGTDTQYHVYQCLAIKMSWAQRQEFMLNDKFSIDFSTGLGTGGGRLQIYEIALNGDGYSWAGQTLTSSEGNLYFDQWDGSPSRTMTVSFDYDPAEFNPDPGWVEIIFSLQDNGATDPYFYFDNAELTPEPATLSLFGLGAIALIRRRKK